MANERPAQFPNDVADLMAWVHGEPLAENHPFGVVEAMPKGETAQEMWILGSSLYGAQVAAHFGLPYSFAWFFTDGRGGQEALDIYRQTYRPSKRHPEPNAGICVWALAADTEDEAQHHYSSRARWQLYRDRGLYLPLDPPEVAMGYDYSEAEMARIDELRRTAFVGAAPQVADRIRELAERTGVDELAIVTWTHDEQARRNSYSLLARELALPALG